jgi:(p)ppGpp synthase/HD superfamily hydrolase
MTGQNNITSQYKHLEAVVARLKNLGITDSHTISAAWLHDIMDYTETSFDELEQRFGSKVAVLVLAISRDKSIPNPKQEEQYVKQLRGAPFEAKLIKLCDISADLRDLRNSSLSKTNRIKKIKEKIFYLNVIKSDLIRNKLKVPGIISLISGINDMILTYGQRPIVFQ